MTKDCSHANRNDSRLYIGKEAFEGAQALAVVWGHGFTGQNYGLSIHSKRLEPQPGQPKKTLWQINRDLRESGLKAGQPGYMTS